MLQKEVYKILDSKAEEIVQIRRHLHKHAEPSLHEFETVKFIKKFYQDKDIEYLHHPVGENGVVVKIKGGKPGKTIAIRADFDAVEMEEQTDVPYKSTNPKAAHTCGHDVHTAIVLEVADALLQVKEELPGNVVIIHQYNEEIPPGGAKFMVADGAMEGVDAVIGGHVWPAYEAGTIQYRTGITMTGRSRFKVVITGRGGHGSQPHKCIDPIIASCHFMTAVQTIVSRKLDPTDAAVVTIGRFDGPGIFNALPNSVTMEGDVRSCSDESSTFIRQQFTQILKGITEAFGCTYELKYENDYPAVINDKNMVQVAERAMEKYPIDGLRMEYGEMNMASEDFSEFMKKAPGLFVFFGARPEGEWYPNHHPKFTVDEGCLLTGAKFLANVAIEYLEENQ